MHVDAYMTVVCEEVKRGCEFRALFYDRATEQFYGGSGPTALEAVAWCLDEYCYRGLLGRGHRLARDPRERPGDRLRDTGQSSAPPPTTPGPSPTRSSSPSSPDLADTSAKDEVGCFERKIPKRAELALHGQEPRRATGKRRR